MSWRWIGAAIGLIAAVALTGTVWAAVYAASPSAGTSAPLVTMPPQSDLEMLSHATLIGAHAEDATIKLTVSLKLRHAAKLKQYLSQANYQRVPPQEFNRLYAPTPAQVVRVKQFCAENGIGVVSVSPDRTLIRTEATTEVYEHALHIQINDYKLDGRRFYSTTDSPEIPRSLAPLVLGILGLNHGTTMHPQQLTPAGLSKAAPAAAGSSGRSE